MHALNKQERREEGALVMKAVLAGMVSLVYCVLSVPLYFLCSACHDLHTINAFLYVHRVVQLLVCISILSFLLLSFWGVCCSSSCFGIKQKNSHTLPKKIYLHVLEDPHPLLKILNFEMFISGYLHMLHFKNFNLDLNLIFRI